MPEDYENETRGDICMWFRENGMADLADDLGGEPLSVCLDEYEAHTGKKWSDD